MTTTGSLALAAASRVTVIGNALPSRVGRGCLGPPTGPPSPARNSYIGHAGKGLRVRASRRLASPDVALADVRVLFAADASAVLHLLRLRLVVEVRLRHRVVERGQLALAAVYEGGDLAAAVRFA